MDFSFVGKQAPTKKTEGPSRSSGPGQDLAGQNPNNQANNSLPTAATKRPLFEIPSYQEVQAAQRPAEAPILFRPTGLTAHANTVSAPNGAARPQSTASAPAAPTTAPDPHARIQPPAAGSRPTFNAAPPGTSSGPGPAPPAFTSWRPPQSSNHAAPAPGVPSTAAGGGGGPIPGPTPSNVILVSRRQQGNPLLKHIRNVRWQFMDITPDYVVGANTCVLFLSLRYHLLHPDYILHRIKEQLRAFPLTLVLCHVDVEDMVKPLGEVTKAAVVNGCTLVCAWSVEECARYLETFKSYESKPAGNIQERMEHDYVSRLTSALTCVRGVNRTDAVTLGKSFGTLADLLRATPEQLSARPGIGPAKVNRLCEAFNQPFRRAAGVQPPRPAAGGNAETPTQTHSLASAAAVVSTFTPPGHHAPEVAGSSTRASGLHMAGLMARQAAGAAHGGHAAGTAGGPTLGAASHMRHEPSLQGGLCGPHVPPSSSEGLCMAPGAVPGTAAHALDMDEEDGIGAADSGSEDEGGEQGSDVADTRGTLLAAAAEMLTQAAEPFVDPEEDGIDVDSDTLEEF